MFVIVRARRAAIATLVALSLLATEGLPHLLILPLLLPPTAPPEPAPAAIIVLAGGRPEFLGASQADVSLETLRRLRTAAALSRATGARILVSGARAPDDAVPLATQMAQSLGSDFDVPATWAETRSTNLWQSADAAAAILHAAGINYAYVVAQPWELRLSTAVFRAAGLAVTPASLPHADAGKFDLDALALDTPGWLYSALALREWVGLACAALAPCTAWMRSQAAR